MAMHSHSFDSEDGGERSGAHRAFDHISNGVAALTALTSLMQLTHSDPRSVDPADVGQLLALILAEIAKGQDEVSVLF